MNPLTVVFFIVVAAIVVAVATPQGRTALKSIVNSLATMFNRGARKLETPERLNEQLKSQVEAETAKNLAEAQAAYAHTTFVLDKDAEDHKALEAWRSNLAAATAKFIALTSDDINDAQQHAAIGAVRQAGEQAMKAIAELESKIAANRETVAAARATRREAQELFSSLDYNARQAIQTGDTAAATVLVNEVSARLAETKAGAGTSQAASTLAKLARMNKEASARRKAAEAREAAMPKTAEEVAQQLANIGQPSTFDAYVAAQAENESAS